MAQRRRPTLRSLQSNPLAKLCWDRHSAKWNCPYPSARPICVEGMSHENAYAEQHTCSRDDLAHNLSPCLGDESSTGLFPDDFTVSGKWFRRHGRRVEPAGSRRRGSFRLLMAKIKPPSGGLARTGVIGDEIIKPMGRLPWGVRTRS
jgi:hypothetical protein